MWYTSICLQWTNAVAGIRGEPYVGEKLQVIVSCATYKGSRETNEDSYLALAGDSAHADKALLGVADGIGGQVMG